MVFTTIPLNTTTLVIALISLTGEEVSPPACLAPSSRSLTTPLSTPKVCLLARLDSPPQPASAIAMAGILTIIVSPQGDTIGEYPRRRADREGN